LSKITASVQERSQEEKMNNNDILRRLRYALNINDSTMIELFKLSAYEIARSRTVLHAEKEDEPYYVDCSDRSWVFFWTG
jgi:uncharacterized protein YehS (DUF1456 family)